MVKVIWHKAASPPQTYGSIVFAGWHQCPLPRGHIGSTWRIWLNLCFLWPTRVHNPNGKLISSAICTAHGKVWSGMPRHVLLLSNCPFPWGSGPHLIRASSGPSEYITQTASRSVQLFLHRWQQSVPPIGDVDPHLIHRSLNPPESLNQTASRSLQPFFAGLTSVTGWPTNHATR